MLVWTLVLFGAGLLIVAVEVLVPSGGLLGVAALACLIGSLVCAYQVSGWAAVVLACIEGICVPAVVILMFKILPKTSLGKQLILSPPGETNKGDPKPNTQQRETGGEYDGLLGKCGQVVTALRPSGTVEISGRRLSVVSNGEAIAENTRVRVTHIEGNRIVVEAVKE
jgi:membrane-bound serine protease (ClpP class)